MQCESNLSPQKHLAGDRPRGVFRTFCRLLHYIIEDGTCPVRDKKCERFRWGVCPYNVCLTWSQSRYRKVFETTQSLTGLAPASWMLLSTGRPPKWGYTRRKNGSLSWGNTQVRRFCITASRCYYLCTARRSTVCRLEAQDTTIITWVSFSAIDCSRD